MGTRLYHSDATTAQLVAYDLVSGVTEPLLSSSSGQLVLQSLKANGEQQLLVAESDSSALWLVDSDHSITPVNCITDNIPEDIYFLSDVILFTKAHGDEDSVFVVDRTDCTLRSSYSIAKDVKVRDSRELFDEYVLWSDTANWADFILYDVAEQSFTKVYTVVIGERQQDEELHIYYDTKEENGWMERPKLSPLTGTGR